MRDISEQKVSKKLRGSAAIKRSSIQSIENFSNSNATALNFAKGGGVTILNESGKGITKYGVKGSKINIALYERWGIDDKVTFHIEGDGKGNLSLKVDKADYDFEKRYQVAFVDGIVRIKKRG